MGFGWAFFLVSFGSPHVRPMGRTCGGPSEIELTPIRVELNSPRRVHIVRELLLCKVRLEALPGLRTCKRAVTSSASTRMVNSISFGTPHVRPMWALSTSGA